jgi:outer membrane protein assembly factor BamB
LTAADPRTVGEFRLRARLGAGGMGQVFLASSLAGRIVAVKVIHAELARDAEFIRRFRIEVSAAQRVSGLYTAPVVAAGVDDTPPWLATAFVPGPSLEDIVLRHGPLPVPALWRLAGGLAEALRAIHATGLVHRDLKPANVLLAADGPRVIDFGIARAMAESRLTATGSVIGTPSFMSPEQVEGQVAGPPSDVFSLGSVLAFAGSGTAPFAAGPGGSNASVMYRIVHGEADLSAVDRSVGELVGACLAKDPAHRPDLGHVAAYCAEMSEYLGLSAAAFWPADVAQVISAKQAELTTQLHELQGTPAAPADGLAGGPVGSLAGNSAGSRGTTAPTRIRVPMPTGPSRPGAPGYANPPVGQGFGRRGLLIGAGVAGIAVVGGVAGWAISSRPSAATPPPSKGGTSQPTTGSSQPAVGGPTQDTGQGPGSKAWSFATGSQVLASPGVANGVVYVGSKDNYVYAVSARAGTQVWRSQVGWVLLAPQAVGDMVCVVTNTGEFSAIHAGSGTVAWQVRTGVPAAFARPWAVSGRNVILCSTTGPLQAYDAATGGQGRTYGSQGQFYRTASAAGGMVYAMDESGTLHAFGARSGALLWNTAVVNNGDVPSTSLVVGGGAVYVGSTGGTLYSVNARTGHANWSYPTGNELESAPVVTDGRVYFTDTGGKLYALTAAGKPAWQHAAGAGLEGPAAAGGKVYVSTGIALQELDAKSGDAGWSYSPPTSGVFVSTPAVADGLVFIGCTDDSVYALRA